MKLNKLFIISFILIIIFSLNMKVKADIKLNGNILTILFNSAVETDRYQSYNWHMYSKHNTRKIANFYEVYEWNPIMAGTSRSDFNERVTASKYLVNSLPYVMENKGLAWLIYAGITIVEVANVIDNDMGIKNMQFHEEDVIRPIMIEMSFKF